jgi:transposase
MARSETLAHVFEQPTGPVHRRFEVCRAYFLNRLTAPAIAHRFGLQVGTVQAIVRDFAAHPDLDQFFRSTQPGRKTSPKREALSERALERRRQGRSVGQIRAQLGAEGHPISESYLAAILRSQGFLPLRRRGRPPRPGASARDGSEVPAMAAIRELSAFSRPHSPDSGRRLVSVPTLVTRGPLLTSGSGSWVSWSPANPSPPSDAVVVSSQAIR